MPKVQAWECPHTKQLFALKDEGLYRAHLAHLAKERKRQQKIDEENARHYEIVEEARNTCRTPNEIAKWLKDNFEVLYRRGKTWPDDELSDDFEIESVRMTGRYCASCSNSHSAPRGKKQNWGGTKLKDDGSPVPRGYPGLIGNFEMKYKGSIDGFLSSVLDKLGIATGSGGGHTGSSRYDLTLWLDDWPAMKQNVEEQMIINKLSGADSNIIKWND